MLAKQPNDITFAEGPFNTLPIEIIGEIIQFLMLRDLSKTSLVNKKLNIIVNEYFSNLPPVLKTKMIQDQKAYDGLWKKSKRADDKRITALFNLISLTSNAIKDSRIYIPSCELPLYFMLYCFLTLGCLAMAAGVYPWLVYQYRHADKHSEERQQYLNAALGVGIPGIICFFVCCLCSCATAGKYSKIGGGEIKPSNINHRVWLGLIAEFDKFVDEISELENCFPDIKEEITDLKIALDKLDKKKLPREKAVLAVSNIHNSLNSFRTKLGNQSYSFLLLQSKPTLRQTQTTDTVINMPRLPRKFK